MRHAKPWPTCLTALILAVLPAATVAFSASAAPTDPVTIGDAALRHCVERALGFDAGTTITEADMAKIGSLSCRMHTSRGPFGFVVPDPERSPYGAVYSLSGLQFAVNLSSLGISGNAVADLSPVAGLPLTSLHAGDNGLSDLSPLAAVSTLTTLGLGSNAISSLGPLAGLTSLTDLYLPANAISDVSALAGLESLTTLLIGVNGISDVSALGGLTSLQVLQLNGNSITDVAALAALTALTDLQLQNNAISDIAALAANLGLGEQDGFTLGDYVDLTGNPLNREAYATHIPALQSRGANVYFDPYDPTVGDPPDGDPPPPGDPPPDDPPGGGEPAALAAIPDAALRHCVERALDKVAGAAITAAEMADIEQFSCDGVLVERAYGGPEYDPERSPYGAVASLAGLELAVNLSDVSLSRNAISDLSPLAGLPLVRLTLYNNEVSDLSPLAGTASLRELSLSGNPLSGLSPISGMAGLEWLAASGASISDVSPLAGLEAIRELWLGGNAISDVTPLAGLTSLTKLNLGANAISNIAPLGKLTSLQYLGLYANSIADVSALVALTALTELHLQDNAISDVSALALNAGLGTGDYIDLSRNPLDSPARIKHIPGLEGRGATVYYDAVVAAIPDAALRYCIERTLAKEAGASITEAEMAGIGQLHCVGRLLDDDVWGNRVYDPEFSPHGAVADLTGLEFAVNLSELRLRFNAVSDLSPVAGLPLVHLGLRANNVSDLSPLAGMPLANLGVSDNYVSDLSPLAGMASLRHLTISGNPLTDLSPIAGMTGLEWLAAIGNSISDVSPLAGLASLAELWLGANAIEDVAPLAGLTSLTKLNLGANAVSDIAPLGKLTSLKYLGLYSNSIEDISALRGLRSLRELHLSHNAVSDLTPLGANGGLGDGDYVDVTANPVACGSRAEPVLALRARGALVYVDSVVLPAPEDLVATPGDASVALRWGASECSVDRYEFRLGTGAPPTFGPWRRFEHGGRTAQTVDGLTNGLVHVFEVRAFGDAGGHASRVQVALAASPKARVAIADAQLSAGIVQALNAMAERNSPPSAKRTPEVVITQGQMAMLTDLDLSGSGIADLRGLEHAVNLRGLALRDNEIASLSPIANLRFLHTLDVAGNGIADVSALGGLDALSSLWLGTNRLTDVTTLGDLAGLAVLALDGNQIADVSPLAGLERLERLWLNDNGIADISPLAANAGLGEGEVRLDGSSDYVDLRGNPLNSDATGVHAPTLRARGAAVLVDDPAYRIPAFATAGNPVRQSLLRVVNPTDQAGDATLSAIDAGGGRFGPVTLSIGAGKAVNLNAHDLEAGNVAKGLASGMGPGDGDWRLELRSPLPLGVSAYMGGHGTLTTSMNALAPERYAEHRVGVFFGSSARQTSLLRLINLGAKDARVLIKGVDDSGAAGQVAVSVPAGGSHDFSAAALEDGAGPGVLAGGLGRGAAMWRLTATSYDGVQVVNVLEDAAGNWANLSAAPNGEAGHLLLFPAASRPGRPTGLARVINHSDRRGTVQVRAIDGDGRTHAAGSFRLEPGQAKQFTSADLEQGNSAIGLRGVGAGRGDWRLALDADVTIGVYGFLHEPSGLLGSLQERVPVWRLSLEETRASAPPLVDPQESEATGRRAHRLMFFKPSGNSGEASRLRLVNMSRSVANVRISGIDDDGKAGGTVRLSLAAGAARELTAEELETGRAPGVAGSLGVGNGMWRLVVDADAKVEVLNLLDGPDGRLTNLSAGD